MGVKVSDRLREETSQIAEPNPCRYIDSRGLKACEGNVGCEKLAEEKIHQVQAVIRVKL